MIIIIIINGKNIKKVEVLGKKAIIITFFKT